MFNTFKLSIYSNLFIIPAGCKVKTSNCSNVPKGPKKPILTFKLSNADGVVKPGDDESKSFLSFNRPIPLFSQMKDKIYVS